MVARHANAITVDENGVAGDWIIIRGESFKWSEVDPQRWAKYQKIAARKAILEQQYQKQMRRLVDAESMLVEETRRRYPGTGL